MEPECECDIAARRQGRMRYARAHTKVEWGAACGAWPL